MLGVFKKAFQARLADPLADLSKEAQRAAKVATKTADIPDAALPDDGPARDALRNLRIGEQSQRRGEGDDLRALASREGGQAVALARRVFGKLGLTTFGEIAEFFEVIEGANLLALEFNAIESARRRHAETLNDPASIKRRQKEAAKARRQAEVDAAEAEAKAARARVRDIKAKPDPVEQDVTADTDLEVEPA
jgi:hypothetical protein